MAKKSKHPPHIKKAKTPAAPPPPPPLSPRDKALAVAFHTVLIDEIALVPSFKQSAYHECLGTSPAMPLGDRGILLEKALEITPNNPYTTARLAFFYAATKSPKARQMLDRACHLARSSGISFDRIESGLTSGL